MKLPKYKIDLNAVVDMAMKQVLDDTTVNDVSIREWIDRITTGEYKPVKHGRWKTGKGKIYCTNCEKSAWAYSFCDLLKGFKFCPNCGADMRGEEE